MMSAVLTVKAQTDSGTMTPPLVLALDISTSGVRAALYDRYGLEVTGAQAQLARTLQTTVDGGAELDAPEAIEQVISTIDALLSKAAAKSARIELVAVSCFWHSLLGVDREGRALTPVFGWADVRAWKAAEELRQQFDERKTHARTGCRFHPSYWPSKLRWLQTERSDMARAVHGWMSLGEFLLLSLLGETAASVSMASGTGLLHQRSCSWDEELLAWLKLSPERLPAIATEKQTFAPLKDEYARRWPQLCEARWFAAVADGAANNVGAGCTTRESAALMVGTSGALRLMDEAEPPALLPPELWCYRADERRVLLGGALSDGGGLHAWMKASLSFSTDAEATEKALGAMEPDAHGLTILPFWAGERSTGWHASARGAILGLTMHTEPLDILRAAMEGVAYRFALIYDALQALATPMHFVASGGALRSSQTWTQIIADVLGRPLRLSGVREASSRGAVLLALESAGAIVSIRDAPAPTLETYEPDAERHARYRAALRRQQSYYELLVEK
jgi:gluconokinase